MDQEPDERSRLMSQSDDIPVDVSQQSDAVEIDPTFPRRNLLLSALVISLILVLVCSSILQTIPLYQVLEENICQRLHPGISVSKDFDCGDSQDVQAELALLKGWQLTITLIPGILTAIPFGFMADKYGRKPIMLLCLVGIGLSSSSDAIVCFWPEIFSPRLILVSPVFMLLGGGDTIFTSFLYSMLSDLAPDAYRATSFFTFGAGFLVTKLLVTPLASSLMQRDPWLSIFLGLGIHPLTIVIALLIPETKDLAVPSTETTRTATNPNTTTRDGRTDAYTDSDASEDGPGDKALWLQIRGGLQSIRKGAAFLLGGSYVVVVLLLTLLTTTFGKMASDVLLQFARKRFKWSWSKAGYIMSYQAAVNLLLLLVILPAFNYGLIKILSLQPKTKDIFVARFSCIVMIVGNLLIALSPTSGFFLIGIGISSLGIAYGLVLRSLIAQLVEPHHRAILFTTMAMLEEIGAMLAGPLLAFCFRVGLSWDGVWTGLPFMAATALFAVTLAALYSVRL